VEICHQVTVTFSAGASVATAGASVAIAGASVAAAGIAVAGEPQAVSAKDAMSRRVKIT